MTSIPRYSSRVLPVAFSASVTQQGITVWTCKHKHPTQDEARACSIAEVEIMKAQAYHACPACKDDVDYTTEHLNYYTREWVCVAPRKSPVKRRKSSV